MGHQLREADRVADAQDAPAGSHKTRRRASETALVIAAALVVAVTLFRIAETTPRDSGLHIVSAVWTALANDLAHGEFYRPNVSADGYGGTRYMPLHFVLHSLLIRAAGPEVPPQVPGYVIAFASIAGLTWGLYHIFRASGLRRRPAAACAVLWLATMSGQYAATTIRGDLLAAALNVLGLACCVSAQVRRSRGWLVSAAVFFVLAFSAKLTTVFGVAAATGALVFGGRGKDALVLAGLTLFGMAVVLLGVNAASQGRWLEAMRACLLGGSSVKDIVAGPVNLLRVAVNQDVFALFLWMAAVAALAFGVRSMAKNPLLLAFPATAAVTAFMFGSRGISYNHFLDLNVAAIIAVVVWGKKKDALTPLAASLLAFVAVAGSGFAVVWMHPVDVTPKRENIRRVVEAISALGEPVLSETAMVPLVRGERPYVMDSFALAVLCRRDAGVRRDFLDKVERREFAAVILQSDPRSELGRRWYGRVRFCEGFADAVVKHYRLAEECGGAFIFVPETDAAQSETPQAAP